MEMVNKNVRLNMRLFLLYLQHILNPLHIYCRLVDLHINQNTALKIAYIYDRGIFRFINLLNELKKGD